MSAKTISRTMILGLLVILTACSPGAVVQPTQDTHTIYTAAAQTIQAHTPTQAATPATPVPATANQTAVEQPTWTSAPAVSDCEDSAQYIRDDGLDGTTYAPNTPFTKTWTVKNTSSCTWDSSYLVFQLSGAFMTQQPGYFMVPQGQTVAPGQTVNISIGMTSPVEDGNYKSYWGLKNADGQVMPVQGGANGNSFYVEINVNNSSVAAGKVTAASIDIELEQGSGTACTPDATYFVHAYITADGPTTASYEIGSTAGQISAGNFQDNGLSPFVTGTVVFDQADTKTIDLRFVGPYPYPDNITVFLRVNGGEFYNTKLSCQE